MALPWGHWKTTTSSLRCAARASTALTVIDGAMTGDLFVAYVEQQLRPCRSLVTSW
ncbi:MAG: hypothetical protein U1F68_12540 [Gammaproteobacteria bacterium]